MLLCIFCAETEAKARPLSFGAYRNAADIATECSTEHKYNIVGDNAVECTAMPAQDNTAECTAMPAQDNTAECTAKQAHDTAADSTVNQTTDTIATLTHRSSYFKPAVVIPEKRDTVRLHYRWDKFYMDSTYMDNAAKFELIDSLLGCYNRVTDSLYIISSASPEGNIPYNSKLSLKRGQDLQKQIQDSFKGDWAGEISIVPLGSNFEEFVETLRKDSEVSVRIPYRSEVIAEFDNNPGENRDITYRRMAKLHDGVPYRYIKNNILKGLRYAELVIVTRPLYPPLLTFEEMIACIEADLDYTVGEVEDDEIEVEDEVIVAPMLFADSRLAAEQLAEKKERKYWYPAVKTNILYDAVTALNAEIEFPIGKHVSLMVEDVFPWWAWGPNDKKYCFQLLSIGVEPRWWFIRNDKKDYLSGHFAGVYGMSGKYDFQWDKTLCYQGEFWSAGLTYGYAMPVCKWLNMEFSLSVGYLQSDYRHYQPDGDYEHLYRDKYKVGKASWFGPTKAKISLVIPIGKDSHNKDSRNNDSHNKDQQNKDSHNKKKDSGKAE